MHDSFVSMYLVYAVKEYIMFILKLYCIAFLATYIGILYGFVCSTLSYFFLFHIIFFKKFLITSFLLCIPMVLATVSIQCSNV